MMPFLWNWAGKEAIKAFPWKWVLLGLAVLFAVVAGWHVVSTYNSAIEERDRLAVEKRIVEEEFEKKLHENALLKVNNERLVNYMENAELARLQLENRLRAVATRKVKRDTQGNVAPDDPLLADLNNLFGSSDRGQSAY